MNRSVSSYLVGGIIVLGAIGLISRLIYNPAGLFKSIMITILIAGIVYFVYRRLTKGKTGRREQRAFLKAARKSKKRHSLKTNGMKDNVASFSAAKSRSHHRPRRKSDAQLTVIEGKKNKKKNRALF